MLPEDVKQAEQLATELLKTPYATTQRLNAFRADLEKKGNYDEEKWQDWSSQCIAKIVDHEQKRLSMELAKNPDAAAAKLAIFYQWLTHDFGSDESEANQWLDIQINQIVAQENIYRKKSLDDNNALSSKRFQNTCLKYNHHINNVKINRASDPYKDEPPKLDHFLFSKIKKELLFPNILQAENSIRFHMENTIKNLKFSQYAVNKFEKQNFADQIAINFEPVQLFLLQHAPAEPETLNQLLIEYLHGYEITQTDIDYLTDISYHHMDLATSYRNKNNELATEHSNAALQLTKLVEACQGLIGTPDYQGKINFRSEYKEKIDRHKRRKEKRTTNKATRDLETKFKEADNLLSTIENISKSLGKTISALKSEQGRSTIIKKLTTQQKKLQQHILEINNQKTLANDKSGVFFKVAKDRKKWRTKIKKSTKKIYKDINSILDYSSNDRLSGIYKNSKKSMKNHLPEKLQTLISRPGVIWRLMAYMFHAIKNVARPKKTQPAAAIKETKSHHQTSKAQPTTTADSDTFVRGPALASYIKNQKKPAETGEQANAMPDSTLDTKHSKHEGESKGKKIR